jgi:hypothetical protein
MTGGSIEYLFNALTQQTQGQAAEDAEIRRLQNLDPRAKIETQLRMHALGVPGYMVVDIMIGGNGNLQLHITEVKSGAATLSTNQVQVLSEAIRSGNVFIVN